jgi:predicted dehydrogenase
MPKTKIAIVGLGGVAQLVHLPVLSKFNDAEVTSVAEINKSRLNTIADKFSIKDRYTDYKELLSNSDVDAVIIATPTSTHQEVAIGCLKAGKDVLIEKPLARSYKEARPIIDEANRQKRKIMVGMNLRYRPDAMILKSLLNSGEIGDPFYVKCSWIRRQSSDEKWFTKIEESGGGVIIDLGILLLDLSLWLLDYPPVETVSTQSFYLNTHSVEDTSVSLIRCSNSSVINLETSWSLPLEKDHFSLNVYGSKGNASINPFRITKKVEDQYIDLTPSRSDNAMSLFKKSYINELKSFIGAVRGLNPVFSSGEEALQRMKILDAMYKSAEIKGEVRIQHDE